MKPDSLPSRWSSVLLTDEALDRLEALTRAASPDETGGVIFPDGWVEECPNRAADSASTIAYVLHPQDARSAGNRWINHLLLIGQDIPDADDGPIEVWAWHSHPAGPQLGSTPGPSLQDLRNRTAGVKYLVVTLLPEADSLTGRTCHFARY